ncbi:OLC1v1001209C1 [Oldenlandia corymbosa var. corymbosa]|uniref:myrcene synthase n=1 Tax=Oldenlandia corymbosa var. corymbosa TaxID=529605 RepID=A0AAV1D732_OLDCO|nr:OLC1v1001209C1 [Oldenlandia corymbosa var. corymbosa]
MVTNGENVSIPAETGILRRLADFPEDIWSHRFHFDTLAGDMQMFMEMYAEEIELLKEEVKVMINDASSKVEEKLKLIDTVERIGISYHFGREIEIQLKKILAHRQANYEEEFSSSYDLFTAALHFRLFRQRGFNISCGIFHKFLDSKGRFKESLCNDMKGLLSLYEATQVRTHEDIILDEAFDFAIIHLKHGIQHMSCNLAKQVKYAITQPLHMCIPRVVARRNISIYEEQSESPCMNQSLLRLAKLDFNFLQLLYKQELSEIFRWAEESEIISKLPYSRARLVESYLFGLGMFYEPWQSFGRIISAKTTLLITAIDDTYDSYGTLDELQTFTDSIERWDFEEMDRLPQFMRTSYEALLDVSEGVEKELNRQGRLFASNKYKEEWKEYARKSYIEAKWFLRRQLPTFPDYLKNGLTTSLCYLLIPTALLAVENATQEVYDWLADYPNILVSVAKICRLSNDIGSHEREKQIGGTGIECYMNHYGVMEHEAMAKFEDIVENAWKDVNGECLKLDSNIIKSETLTRFLNLARIVHVFYEHRVDGFTNARQVLEQHIVALLVDPIILVAPSN